MKCFNSFGTKSFKTFLKALEAFSVREYRRINNYISTPPSVWNVNAMLKDNIFLKSRSPMKLESVTEERDRSGGQWNVKSLKALHGRKNQPEHRIIAPVRFNSVLNAVIIIQRAYRRYKRRMMLRSSLQKKQSNINPTHEGKSQRSTRHSTHHIRKKDICKSYLQSMLLKDYLKEGSLFFAERESVIVFGGIDPHSKYGDGRNTGRNIFRYHSEMNQWELVGELPQPRHHHAVVFFKGRIYLAGGTDPRDDEKGKTDVVATVWSFEPTTKSWYRETEMQTPRKNFGLVVLNGKLLAIGGQDRNGRIINSVESYDTATGIWEYIAPLNVKRTGAAAAKYRDTVWVAGGMTGSSKSPLTYSVESYDPKHNIWVQQSPLRFPRCFGCLFAMNDILYLIGGAGRTSEKERTTSSCNAIDVWNPRDEEWKLHFAMSIPRHGHAVAYLGTQLLIIGGVTTAYLRALTDIECFCCERKTWVKGLANLPVPLSGHGAVTLPPASLI